MRSYPMSRRTLLAGSGAVAALALAGCADSSDGGASVAGGPWEFTDDRDTRVTRPGRPQRIVAYVSTGAALWDFGVRLVGVFGPTRSESGAKEIQAGNIDLATVESVGQTWDDFNLDKFAALNPDLVVTGRTGPKPTDLWAISEDTGRKIQQVAPIVALSEYKGVLPRVIERYEQLARALGADVEAAPVTTARDEFRRASDELRAAAREKAGLKILVLYSDKDNIYVAKPEFFSDLAYYRELGLDIVTAGGPDDWWEMLSWEQIGKYPADLILTDVRSFSLTRQQMAAYPTWTQLPAVRAGQVGDWSAEPRFNHQLATPIIRSLTAVIKNAKTDIVA